MAGIRIFAAIRQGRASGLDGSREGLDCSTLICLTEYRGRPEPAPANPFGCVGKLLADEFEAFFDSIDAFFQIVVVDLLPHDVFVVSCNIAS